MRSCHFFLFVSGLLHVSIMSSKFIHALANGRISFLRLNNHIWLHNHTYIIIHICNSHTHTHVIAGISLSSSIYSSDWNLNSGFLTFEIFPVRSLWHRNPGVHLFTHLFHSSITYSENGYWVPPPQGTLCCHADKKVVNKAQIFDLREFVVWRGCRQVNLVACYSLESIRSNP